jgi:hypothetical protein
VGWIWRDGISRHVAAWYWMRQCLTYSPPPGKVVWEGDPVEARKLLAAKPDEYLPCIEWAYVRAPCLEGLARQFQWMGPGGGIDLVVYLHERTARGPGGGQKRLVRVATGTPQDGYYVGAECWSTSTFLSTPKEVGHCVTGPERINAVRIYAGQADPKDDSHFTVEYETPTGGRGKVDGWLEADDSITLVVGPVSPATTRP